MSIPGWYPDPAGQPNRYRWWDGQRWSEVTTENPSLPPPPPGFVPPPPVPPAPPPPGPPSTPPSTPPPGLPGTSGWGSESATGGWGGGWTPMTPPPSGGGGSKGPVVVLAVLAALLLVAAAVGGYLLVRGGDRSGEDRSSQSGAAGPEATEEATDEASDGATGPLEECPTGDPMGPNRLEGDRVLGGGLSFEVPAGYRPSPNKLAHQWLTGASGVERLLEPRWISLLTVGLVLRADGYSSPEQAAVSIARCMATSPNFYADHVSDRLVSSRRTTVDGHEAWEVRHDVRIDTPGLRARGARILVVVVDPGDAASYGVFAGDATLGDPRSNRDMERAARSLRVE